MSLTGTGASNYALASSTATTTASITPAPASVTPNQASKIYGMADPALTGTLTGFLPADGVTATFNRSAGESVAASPYTIGGSLSPAEALGNYAITYGTADFAIMPATPVTTWADPADITYPTPLGGTQLNATANTTGSFAYTPAAGTVLDVGNSTTVDQGEEHGELRRGALGTEVRRRMLRVVTRPSPYPLPPAGERGLHGRLSPRRARLSPGRLPEAYAPLAVRDNVSAHDCGAPLPRRGADRSRRRVAGGGPGAIDRG